jgi:hypothetical protein
MYCDGNLKCSKADANSAYLKRPICKSIAARWNMTISTAKDGDIRERSS